MTNPITIIGMGMAATDLTAAQMACIQKAEVLVGGRRHLAEFAHLTAKQIEISSDLDAIASELAPRIANGQRVVVLASGDPLFFGIGNFLVERLGLENVRIQPNVTAVGAAFARLGRAWNEAATISCHGHKGFHRLLALLAREPLVAVLTDPRNTPAAIARELQARGLTDAVLHVLEHMGSPDEKVKRLSVAQAALERFADPNVLVIEQPLRDAGAIGEPEASFDRSAGLITKAEVRAVSLAKLRIAPGHTVWDLGAGSGSVALEAALLAWRGRVVAVEKNAERVRMIAANRQRLGRWHVDVLQAQLPEGMADLPRPHRVFVGGGGNRLKVILERAVERMTEDGIIVANTVLLESLHAVRSTFKRLGLASEVVQIQVSRGRPTAVDERLEAQNPVWIVSGTRNR